jgi:hypothetical protein
MSNEKNKTSRASQVRAKTERKKKLGLHRHL